jgi:hypothetical protein
MDAIASYFDPDESLGSADLSASAASAPSHDRRPAVAFTIDFCDRIDAPAGPSDDLLFSSSASDQRAQPLQHESDGSVELESMIRSLESAMQADGVVLQSPLATSDVAGAFRWLLTQRHALLRQRDETAAKQHSLRLGKSDAEAKNAVLAEKYELLERELWETESRRRKLETESRAAQKAAKEQIAKLSKDIAIVANRDEQYKHEMRRREKDFTQLQTRLQQGFASSSKENSSGKLGIEVLNPLKPVARPKWRVGAHAEDELVQRELSGQEERIRALSQENADLRSSLHELFAELQSAMQTEASSAAPAIDVLAAKSTPASTQAMLLSPETRHEIENALKESEFADAQLALPFGMIRSAAEVEFRSRVALLQDRRARDELEREADQRAIDAATAAAAAAQSAEQKAMLLTLVGRIKDYRSIITEQESILQAIVVNGDGVSRSSAALTVENSRRLSLDVDLDALSRQERKLADARSHMQTERQEHEHSTIQLLRQEHDVESKRQDLEVERLAWMQQRRLMDAFTISADALLTPAKTAAFASPSAQSAAKNSVSFAHTTPKFARLARNLAADSIANALNCVSTPLSS